MDPIIKTEEEAQRLLATPRTEDIFKHENEMNPGTTLTAADEFPSAISSPTRPLNFPNTTVKLEPRDKDFSSSSDTCISETESRESPVKQEKSNNSFDRNFDFDSSDQAHQTVDFSKQPLTNDFTFTDSRTPMTSTTELHRSASEPGPVESPNRSIMKKSVSSSPRKSVAFTSTNPEIHRYPAPTTRSPPSPSPPAVQLDHQWTSEINKSSSSDDDDVRPPSPPPHTSFNSLLNNNSVDDVDAATLSQLKLRRNSQIPLEEKVDIYLSQKQNNGDLDQHLETMNRAVALQNQSNIHHLSLDLQKYQTQDMENPLQSLADTSDVQLKSSGSSHSSLQSLREENRVLQSYAGWSGSKGIELNEGIKGMSDTMVESLIPQDLSSDQLEFTIHSKKIASEENSYDTTEKSIMNLLNGSRDLVVNPLVPENPQADVEESTSHHFTFTQNKDESDLINDTGHFSLRDHVDSEWKFEDSHDGDKEDNSDYTKNDVTEVNEAREHHDGDKGDNSDYTKNDVTGAREQQQDTNPVESSPPRSLAPPRSPQKETFDRPVEPEPVAPSKEENVLANSSNIAPPEELTLPQVEVGNYSSFENITKNLDRSGSAFEESLSAENDIEKVPTDFLSIWRTHEKKKTHQRQAGSSHILKELDVAHSSALVADEQRHLPKSMLPSKFREVNVLSRRVVDTNDDLHVSGFLPELSDDSGFETHFKSMLREANSTMNTGNRQVSMHRPLSTANVLSNLDDQSSITTNGSAVRNSLRPEPVHVALPRKKITVKPSKFKVPSFEIKRSTSILSPRNMYNDIYEDTVKAPTIRGTGMKTLPSMDRGDVKRILETKRVISQDEYSRLKIGAKNTNREVISGMENNHDSEQQHALIVNTSIDTELVVDKDVLPHLASELLRAPTAMLSSDQVFRDYDFYSTASNVYNNSQPGSRVASGPDPVSDLLPEPHPELVHTPKKTELENLQSAYSPEKFNYKVVDKQEKKGDKLSPIKIRSPAKGHADAPKQTEGDIKDHRPHPSTVSVPTMDTTATDFTILSMGREKHDYREALQSQPSLMHERGRLFLRVVGIKNLALPDIHQHKAEFSVTLDNGVHCIKTPSYKLEGPNAIIGKEFELTVCDTLEFILTMKASYEKPRGNLREVKERRTVKSKNRISRMFGSKDVITTTRFVPEVAKDNWNSKIAQDGSFARCYVDLDQYEDKITGKVSSFNLTCFNEWESVEANSSQLTKCQPYKIGQLEVKMLFVPRTEPWETLPISIKSAYDMATLILREADFVHEGYMYQEGGDCETWKKRFFRLNGSQLIAHSEYSLKPRAKINLSKIVEVIYLDKENAQSTGNYRNFSDGLLFEHAFKVKFANGETIEFGADNRRDKTHWISIFQKLVQRNKLRYQPWVKLMMEDAAVRQERRSRPASMVLE